MNIKLEKLEFGKIPDGTSRFFLWKSCEFLTAFQSNGIFQTLEKVRKKVGKKSSKKLKIKNRGNQFVFE